MFQLYSYQLRNTPEELSRFQNNFSRTFKSLENTSLYKWRCLVLETFAVKLVCMGEEKQPSAQKGRRLGETLGNWENKAKAKSRPSV